MKTKKEAYVREKQHKEQLPPTQKENSACALSMDEQIELFARIIIDQFIKELHEKK